MPLALLITASILHQFLVLKARAADPVPNVPWKNQATFTLDTRISDEFDGSELDESKWDVHGLRNADTQCPSWNGPLSTSATDSTLSTFFATSTDPQNPTGDKVRMYKVEDGSLKLNIQEKPEDFFAQREYYCDENTFHCNHDQSIPCYWTDMKGRPLWEDKANGIYKGMTHDKCKIEPYCLPHYQKVSNQQQRPYSRWAGTHITGHHLFQYGYIETRVKVAQSMAVFAVWMHGRELSGSGYCRYKRKDAGSTKTVRECPSHVNSKRWSEIDLVEAMNTATHSKKYIPNIHVFSGSKGEFTSPNATDSKDSGNMGGGPIIIDNIFKQGSWFKNVPQSERIPNDFHMNSGSVHTLSDDWYKEWHVLGCFWTPNGIRFYVDGEEVHNVENALVHQPMAIDLSNSMNAGWAGQHPSGPEELARYGQIDYLRVWKVETDGGQEPPSNLAQNNVMTRRFDNRYGYNLHDVHNVYPHNDDLTVFPVEDEDGNIEFVSRMEGEDAFSEPLFWRRQSDADERFDLEYYELDNNTDLDAVDHQKNKNKKNKNNGKNKKKRKEVGGKKGLRARRRARKMTKVLRLGEESREDRAVTFIKIRGKRRARKLDTDDAAFTLFDLFNPMDVGAGHSTKNGEGRGT